MAEGINSYEARLSRFPENINRFAQYIGSFHVSGADHHIRAENVRKQLESARDNYIQSKPIVLIISLSGIKVCGVDGKELYMAHALRRISYATCDPDFRQFAFLAREPRQQPSSQYCHAFVTNTSQEAEDLNSILGESFRLAYYLQQVQSSLSTKNEDSNKAVDNSFENKSPISPAKSMNNERTSLTSSERDLEPDSTNSENVSPLGHCYDVANSSCISRIRASDSSSNYEKQATPEHDSSALNAKSDNRHFHSKITTNGNTPVYNSPPVEHRNPLISESEARELEHSPWFQPHISREQAIDYLMQQPNGGFVVRESKSHSNCYALSMRVPIESPAGSGRKSLTGDSILGDIRFRALHFLIQRSEGGVRLKGVEKQWPELPNLILHLTVLQETLPQPLTLPDKSPLNDQNPSFDQTHLNTSSSSRKHQSPIKGSFSTVFNKEEYRCLHDVSSIMMELTVKDQDQFRKSIVHETSH